MLKVIIFLAIFLGPPIFKALMKKNKGQTARKLSSPPGRANESTLSESIFDLFEDVKPAEQQPRYYEEEEYESDFEVERQEQVQESFYAQVEEENIVHEETKTVGSFFGNEPERVQKVDVETKSNLSSVVSKTSSPKTAKSRLKKIDEFSYLKKGILFKEIFDSPVSMR